MLYLFYIYIYIYVCIYVCIIYHNIQHTIKHYEILRCPRPFALKTTKLCSSFIHNPPKLGTAKTSINRKINE